MELETRAAEFAQANTRIFAISYDPVPVLARFAEQHGISYTLLSDEGSQAITRLGLLNLHVAEQQAYAGRAVEPHHTGIPYPGLFLLDEHGVVQDKRFEQTHQPRPAPDLILEDLIGADALPGAVSAMAKGTGVQALAWVSTATYRPMQRLHLHVVLEIDPELHVYGTPVTDGFIPLEIKLTSIEGLLARPTQLPEPHPFQVEGIDEQFVVYEGRVVATIPFQVASNLGDLTLSVGVRYQACTSSVCYLPETLRMDLTLKGLDNLRPERPSS